MYFVIWSKNIVKDKIKITLIINFFKHYPKAKLRAENSFEWIDAMVPRGLKKLDVKLT